MKKRAQQIKSTRWKKQYVMTSLVGGLQDFVPFKYWGKYVVYRIQWRLAANEKTKAKNR